MTSQAPHAIRTVLALVAGLPEQNIRVKTHDIGGGFGGKVPVYPGYVLAVVASLTVGKPVKWIEDRSENLQADSFARDYHIHAELGATKDGKITSLKVKTIADHGYTDAAADPSKFPAGLFNVITGSYDFPNAFVEVDGVYTNKPPGGVAYRCSFRVTEAVHAIERMVDILAHEIGKDPAQLRMENFIQPEQFPYKTPTGWEYDSGNYPAALQKAMDMIDYAGLRKEQAEKRERGELMGIGICSFTEIVGAGPVARLRHHRHQDERRLRDPGPSDRQGPRPDRRRRPRARATRRPTPRSSPRSSASRSATSRSSTATPTPRRTASGPTARARRRRRRGDGHGRRARSRTRPASSPRTCSRRPRTTSSGSRGKFSVKGSPDRFKTIQEIAFAAYTNFPQGMEMGLEAVDYYDPPNLTFPFGSYICVVDIDKGTGRVNVRRFVAIDDCGNIINPMIVDGQIHGGLNMGLAPALYEEITYDELGNNLAGTFMDYLVPTAVESPAWETGKTVTPSPHHPIGAKGVGESATVGAPPAIANAVVDALWHLGRPQHRHPDHAPEGLGHPPREGPGLGRHERPVDLRPSGRARGRRPAVRGRHGRRRPATDLGPSRRVRDRPPGRHDRGLGRRQLRPARRRPRGAPRARRRPAAAAPAVEGRAGRGPARRTASSSWS